VNSSHEISIHDNFLVSYEVLCKRREIRFHTEFRDRRESFERTDVIFTGVACYDFEHDSHIETIIFDIDEVPPIDIYREHAEQFQSGVRYGWPGEWGASAELAAAHFQQHGIRGYELSSSCGMSGWVLAQSMQKVVNATNRNG
jgi:hypothetical protein